MLSKEERLRLDERDAAEVFASPNTGTHHTDDHYRALLTGGCWDLTSQPLNKTKVACLSIRPGLIVPLEALVRWAP